MKVNIYNLKGEVVGEMELPEQFLEELREDIIRKAVKAIWRARIQPYGTKPKAGRMSSAKFRGTRRGYGHSYNWSLARLPRLMLRGGRRVGKVVNVPQAVGGPRAHPPKVEKVWEIKINKKERKLAIRSALAATAMKELVISRGHRVPEKLTLPIIVVKNFESLKKTSQVREALINLGLSEELERASRKKIRSGKGKMRGRKYKKPKSILIVVSDPKAPVIKAAKNLPGVDVVAVEFLNAELLAPGAHPGRLTIFTQEALKKLKEKKLFF
mgnify:CR=1 FL=1